MKGKTKSNGKRKSARTDQQSLQSEKPIVEVKAEAKLEGCMGAIMEGCQSAEVLTDASNVQAAVSL